MKKKMPGKQENPQVQAPGQPNANSQPDNAQKAQATAPPLTPEQTKAQEEMNAQVKEIESAMYSLRFYPVAVNEETKNKAVEKLEGMYSKGNETIRQLLLYMIHENLATSMELRTMHTFEYFKMKSPALDPAQVRMNVYRSMFNYNTSLEGLAEMIRLLGRLKGSDDAAKLLTYHFSHLCSHENEANHILRAAILESLGHSDSLYALRALLEYAHYSDNDAVFGRVVGALGEWEKRLDRTKMPQKDKDGIRQRLKDYMTRDTSESHYG